MFFIFGWLYYSSYYILLGVLVTLMLNRILKKLWLPPLIINAIAVVILIAVIKLGLIDSEAASFAMYFNYVPVVLASIITNATVFAARRLKK